MTSIKNSYHELVMGMLRPGVFGFGGGPSVIPLIRHEAVKRYQWVTEEEFGEVLGLANALPGPIATKMAAYLGYKVKGKTGAAIAVAVHIFPTCLAIIILLNLMKAGSTIPAVTRMLEAVVPVIAVLLGQMAWEFGKKAWKGFGGYLAAGLMLVAFIVLEVANVHPAIIIALFLFYGAFHYRWKASTGRKEQKPS